jgi:hypothetical protein
VTAIFADMGAPIRFVRGETLDKSSEVDPNGLPVHVILHKSTSSQWGLDEWAVGAAVGNYVYVFFPDIMLALGIDPNSRSMREPLAMNRIARAIGRVVAHEVVHIVAPSLPHTNEGVMSAALTKKGLTRQHLYFDPDTAAFVLSKLDDWGRESLPGVISTHSVAASNLSRKK